jgi:hypothetical protein
MKWYMNNHGCFGGGSKSSTASTPPPAPAPTPMPTNVNPIATAQDRAKNLESYRYGLAATIKTGPGGITGAGPELRAPSATGVSRTGNSGGGI